MKDVNIFIAEPGKREAMIAVSALAKAMKEMNKVAIVRCVWRQGQAGVVIGVLTPNISVKDNIVSFPIQFQCHFCFSAEESLCSLVLVSLFFPLFLLSSNFPLHVVFWMCYARSLIPCISMYCRLLRMYVSFSFHLSRTFRKYFSPLKNSRRLLII